MIKQMPNYNISIIVPILSKIDLDAFQNKISFLSGNMIEILIITNTLSLKETIFNELINKYLFVRWIFVSLNNQAVTLGQMLNIALKYASYNYILSLDPNLNIKENFLFSICQFLDFRSNTSSSFLVTGNSIYDAILIPYELLKKVGGYISTDDWCTLYNSLKCKILKKGCYIYPCTVSATIEQKIVSKIKFSKLNSYNSFQNWLMYDWKNPSKTSFINLCTYLKGFKAYEINPYLNFSNRYKCIALIPAYNEVDRINSCLVNVEKYCDGIILLDDDSTDKTFEIASSNKLLLKVKKNRTIFNDLENRNLLLKISSFIASEWLFFIDADEYVDCRFDNFQKVISKCKADIIGLWVVNLWNDYDNYRVDMHENKTLQSQTSGLWLRWRLFRNKGFMQIESENNIHFTTVPYRTTHFISNLLLIHTGYLKRQSRIYKYKFYEKYDKEKLASYFELLDRTISTKPVSSISKSMLNKSKIELLQIPDLYYTYVYYKQLNII